MCGYVQLNVVRRCELLEVGLQQQVPPLATLPFEDGEEDKGRLTAKARTAIHGAVHSAISCALPVTAAANGLFMCLPPSLCPCSLHPRLTLLARTATRAAVLGVRLQGMGPHPQPLQLPLAVSAAAVGGTALRSACVHSPVHSPEGGVTGGGVWMQPHLMLSWHLTSSSCSGSGGVGCG
eukprot:CAMPEP_0202883136 /NCGR_PEP_ID=MMETSP1391-20130828/39006_1 /ASSEMBLY_ACC=CAM_ASM_000867 /TAXON_ID=1034604 /ORGANISM="Chlamydomonas leiostraca, Strain SAG 11-49" /LENGTH=178 /DNA_ID=CAMNT_0049566107 /DNA_START=645 /DNA_END=1177 /DNA_ORIENTATION=+